VTQSCGRFEAERFRPVPAPHPLAAKSGGSKGVFLVGIHINVHIHLQQDTTKNGDLAQHRRPPQRERRGRDTNQQFADLESQKGVGINTVGQELFTIVVQLAFQGVRVVVVKKG